MKKPYSPKPPRKGTLAWQILQDRKKKDREFKDYEIKDNMSGIAKITKIKEENMDLDQYKLEDIEAFMQTEDYEQLDELSKNTLSSYVKKATKDKDNSEKNYSKKVAKGLDLQNKIEVAREKRNIAAQKGKGTGRLQSDAEVKLYGQQSKLDQERHSLSRNIKNRKSGLEKAASKLTKESMESTMDLDQYSIEELQDFIQTEEYDQLDELSKKTLGDYIKKSSDHARGHSFNAGQATANLNGDGIANFEYQAKKSSKRQSGINKATSRLTKESMESLGLLVQAIQEGNSSDISKLFDKLMVEKLSELVEARKAQIAEELFSEERLDELSKETLGKYIKKASRDVEHTARFTSNAMKTSQHEYSKNNRRRDKRQAGINDAVNKIINKK